QAAPLDREREAPRYRLAPALYSDLARQAIEGRIDLDGVEALGIERKPVGGREPTWIQPPPPVTIRPAARSDRDRGLRATRRRKHGDRPSRRIPLRRPRQRDGLFRGPTTS